MDKSYLLKNYAYDKKKLLEYGFSYNYVIFVLTRDIIGADCYFKITLGEGRFDIIVIDAIENEELTLFNVRDSVGSFIGELREKSDVLISDIIAKCFTETNVRSLIIRYIDERFNVKPNFPWADTPNACTFKTLKRDKWFGIIMDVMAERLKIGGKEIVDIINLKNDPEKIKTLIDGKKIIPAYHMNKKMWFTVILNNETDFPLLKSLIDESYEIVEKQR